MLTRNAVIPLVLGLAVAAAAAQVSSTLTPARFVRSDDVVLSFNSPAPVEQVEVYGSTDGGRTWNRVPASAATQTSVQVQALTEGRNDFFVVLHNRAGASSDPPTTGTAPHVAIVLDTRTPIVQLHEITVSPVTDGRPLASFRLNVIEEHLAAAGVRLFVRSGPGQPWRDAGAVEYARRRITHPLPDDLTGLFDLRIVVTDQAGNRAMEDRFGLEVPAAAATRPADNSATLPATPALPEIPATEDLLPPQPDPRLYGLRQQGLMHYDRGEWDLADARLGEALQLAPENPDLLADLGWTRIQTGRTDAAADLFGKALSGQSDHLKALEGLALANVQSRDYDAARGSFERYLRADPKSGRMWLNYGDTLHRLGRSRDAQDAWERVLNVEADLRTAAKARERLRVLTGSSNRAP